MCHYKGTTWVRLLKEMITALSALPLMWALNLRDSRAGTMLSDPGFKISPRLLHLQPSPTTLKKSTPHPPKPTNLQIYKRCNMILQMGSLGNDCSSISIKSSSWKRKGLLAKRSLGETLQWCCHDPINLTGQFLMPTWILSQKTFFSPKQIKSVYLQDTAWLNSGN